MDGGRGQGPREAPQRRTDPVGDARPQDSAALTACRAIGKMTMCLLTRPPRLAAPGLTKVCTLLVLAIHVVLSHVSIVSQSILKRVFVYWLHVYLFMTQII